MEPRISIITLGVEDLPRLLRGGAAVEVDQRTAVTHRARQDREVGADTRHVQAGRLRADLRLLDRGGHPAAALMKRS